MSRAPARHLDSSHPQVEAVKAFVARCTETHGVDRRLIANFDQVWTVNFNHSKHVIHKPEERVGDQKPKYKPSMEKMLASIRQALMLESDESDNVPDASTKKKTYVPQRPVLDAQACISPIEGWRFPRTTTTLSWSDGELGSSWITVKEGSAPEEVIKKLNEEMAGLLTIHVQDSKTHMWNGSTMLDYLQFLSVQLRQKRMKHGLSTEHRALIFCDKASVHQTQAFAQLRQRWQRENCAFLCNGSTDDIIKVPPGWGASGAPNDGFHQWYHCLRQSYQKVSVGQGRYMKLRASLDKLDLAVDGSVRFTILV